MNANGLIQPHQGPLVLDEIISLLLRLYAPDCSPQEANQGQIRLYAYQGNPQIWTLVAPLLSHPHPGVRFFGASAVQTSIQRNEIWNALPEGSAEDLKQSLLGWLARSGSQAYPASGGGGVVGEGVVFRKLGAAVAGLSVRMYGEWEGWLGEVLGRVEAGEQGSGGSATGREGVLEVLRIAVEEVERAELPNKSRLAHLETVTKSIPAVTATLAASLSSAHATAQERSAALRSFTSLLLAGQLNHSALDQLYPLILPHLLSTDTVVPACSAVSELVERSSGVSGGLGVTKFVSRQKCYELVVHWVGSDFVRQAVQDMVDEGDCDDDTYAILQLVVAIGELFIAFLFTPPPAAAAAYLAPGAVNLTLASPETSTFFQLLLAMSGFDGYTPEHYQVNVLPDMCWNALQENCCEEGLVAGPGPGREGRVGREGEWPVVKAVFGALAEVQRRRAQWPSQEVVGTWPKDIVSGFRQQRTGDLQDSLEWSYYVLREDLLQTLVDAALAQVARPRAGENDNYEDLEATLFCVRALESPAADADSPHLGRLFNSPLFASLHSDTRLRSTALLLIGDYAAWFADRPDALLSAVAFVVAGLSAPALSGAAAKALRDLCHHCRRLLVPHLGSFVAVLGGVGGGLEEDEFGKVLEAVGSVVQACEGESGVEPLLALVEPVLGKLEGALAMLEVETARGDPKEECIVQIRSLTALSKGLNNPDDDLHELDQSFDDSLALAHAAASRVLADPRVAAMRARLGRAVERVAVVWADEVEVVEVLSDFVRHSTGDHVPSAVGLDTWALLALATGALERSVSSVWLGMASSLLARLGREATEAELTREQLEKVGRPVEVGLRVILASYGDAAAMEAEPDVVAAFLAFATAVLRHFPLVFAHLPQHLSAVLRFAILALSLQERFSFQATVQLLTLAVQQAYMASASSDAFRNQVRPAVPALVEGALAGVGGRVPRSGLGGLAELLQVVLLRMPEEGRGAVNECLGREGWEWTRRATGEQRGRFGRALLGSRTGKQYRQAVTDFALVCRGVEGTAWAAATAGLG